MAMQILQTAGFAAAVIDALWSHICVTDRDGVIVAVNRAWQRFTEENPPISTHAGVGMDYLKACQSAVGPGMEGAIEFGLGVQAVLEGKTTYFEMEYSCHSPTENRWFLGRVTPLGTELGGVVISHSTITDRKELEFELVRLSTTDPLTGLANRRYFLETADLEVERVQRFGAVASVVMLDLDHFKVVNDTYGHGVGDETLRCLTRVCRELLRKIDVFARIGGEEFAIMMPGTNEQRAINAADKLRQAVGKMTVWGGQNDFNTTASFGVAEVRPTDNGVGDCLARADLALYAAKSMGRNRVKGFSSVPVESTRQPRTAA
jgi:diguanylate cyclase (GGDEF)-like protein